MNHILQNISQWSGGSSNSEDSFNLDPNRRSGFSFSKPKPTGLTQAKPSFVPSCAPKLPYLCGASSFLHWNKATQSQLSFSIFTKPSLHCRWALALYSVHTYMPNSIRANMQVWLNDANSEQEFGREAGQRRRIRFCGRMRQQQQAWHGEKEIQDWNYASLKVASLASGQVAHHTDLGHQSIPIRKTSFVIKTTLRRLPVETQYLKCTYHWWKLAKIFFCIILIFFVCEIAHGIRSLQITPNLVRVYLTWPCCGFSLFTCTSVFVSYIIYFKLNKASESVRRMFMLSITYVGSSRWKFPPGWNEVIR